MNSPKALLVFKEPDAMKSLVDSLELRGIGSVIVNTGMDAIRICNSNEVFLVLLEVDIPDINGYDLVYFLRRQCKSELVFVIMAFFSMAAASLAMSVGINEFVAKPAKEEELVLLIEKYYNLNVNQVVSQEF
ncbi:MAG: response regulator [Bacteroidota bacterium]